MAKIHINNPKQVINGGAKKYYFKVKGLGGPKGDKGDKGDTGATGPQGPQGNAATVSVGSTTTLPVGQDATVQNVGTLYNAVLNFGIPQGPRGPQGATGATGAKGDKGDQGNPGPQGEKGTNATVYIGTTSTLNPGSQATVYNSGTDSNAVLNFGIPKGEKGDTGPMPTIAQTTGQAIDQVMSQKATTDALSAKQATISSSNKLSADLVDDTSTTNKFVTAQDITNWNGKQDALTAGTGIDITGGVISTPAIVPEVVAELPTTGAEGKLYLTPKTHTTQTATGNPITATVAEDTGKIESFQLDGDTFQQSYTGKNLFNENRAKSTYYIDGSGNEEDTGRYDYINEEYSVSGGEDITVSFASKVGLAYVRIAQFRGDGTFIQRPLVSTSPTTVTLSSDARKIILSVNQSNALNFTDLQVEYGSIASTYEPFVGGVPSPSPSYPQDINVVTGTQTISINGTNYPISLGTIELCDIGDYQDYIHKVGEDWIITKRTTSILLNEYSSIYRGNFGTNPFYTALPQGSGGTENTINVISDYFYGIAYTDITLEVPNSIFNTYIDNSPVLYIRNTPWATVEAFKSWLSGHNVKVYTKRTPTDTTITDTNLIAQLEAIRTALLENGTNTITNTATGTNLAGDMEIGYFGFNPTNRYDKFIWLNLNNNYEQIGGE